MKNFFVLFGICFVSVFGTLPSEDDFTVRTAICGIPVPGSAYTEKSTVRLMRAEHGSGIENRNWVYQTVLTSRQQGQNKIVTRNYQPTVISGGLAVSLLALGIVSRLG